ncbi:unnamed protein product [Boreogadus saida]
MQNRLTPSISYATASKPDSRETAAEPLQHAGPGNRVVGVETHTTPVTSASEGTARCGGTLVSLPSDHFSRKGIKCKSWRAVVVGVGLRKERERV